MNWQEFFDKNKDIPLILRTEHSDTGGFTNIVATVEDLYRVFRARMMDECHNLYPRGPQRCTNKPIYCGCSDCMIEISNNSSDAWWDLEVIPRSIF